MTEGDKDIKLMEEAEAFWNSPLGRWMDIRMNDIISSAVSKFKEVDPFDGKAVAKVQNELKNAMKFPEWITEIINIGRWELDRQAMSDDLEGD